MMSARPFAASIALALAVPLGACSLVQADPVAEAQAALDAQDYPAARDHAMTALQSDAGSAEALALLARAQLAMGQGGDALATLERLDRAGSRPADMPLLRAEALLQAGDSSGALAALAGEDGAESWRLRALAHAQAGDDDAARSAFLRGRGADGDKRKLFTAAATFHLDRGDADAARYAVGQVQRLAPQAIETYFVSARLAEMEGRPDLASRAYLAILDLAPNDRPAMLGAIRELDALGRVDLLRDLIARGRSAYPLDVEFLYYEASLHALEGEWTAVRDLMQQHENLIAEHEDARGLYGQALLELGQIEQARALLAPLNRRYPGNAAYARLLARILLESGDRAGARAAMRPIIASGNAGDEDRALAARAAV